MNLRIPVGACLLKRTLSILCLLVFSLATPSGFALDKVSLQLSFFHQFQSAGYYAALEKGYYRDLGLDVSIIEGVGGHESIDSVLSGASQFGIGSSSLLLERHAGKPVVVLGVIFQHSANNC